MKGYSNNYVTNFHYMKLNKLEIKCLDL